MEKPKERMHHCFYCGAEVGVYRVGELDRLADCGRLECTRAARDEALAEREEAHERLDRDLGYR